MISLEKKIQDWTVRELSLISEERVKQIPELSTLSRLCEGKNKRIWNYIIKHVRSRHSTEKIKRILKAKHIDDERKREYKSATYFTDLNNMREKVTSSNERCGFLKSSVENRKERLLSAESTIRKLRNNIDDINQKITILEIITSKYKEKCGTLDSLKYQFHFYLSKKFTSEKINKKASNSFQISDQKDDLGLDYLVSQVLNLVVKKLNDSTDYEPYKVTVKKIMEQKFNAVPLSDILFNMQRMSEISYYSALNKQSIIAAEHISSKKMQSISQKQIQDMKLNHIQSVLTVKKIKKEIENLSNVKDSLFKSQMHSINLFMDSEFQQKVKLLQAILDNEALSVSINFYKDTLSTVIQDTKDMQESIHSVRTKDLEDQMARFYRDFDLLWDLINLVPDTFNEIIKYNSFLQMYANEQVFCSVNSDVMTYSQTLEKDLKMRTDIFWNKCAEGKVILPLLSDPIPQEPDALLSETEMQRCYQVNLIASKIKHFKEVLRGYRDDGFQFKYESISIAEEKYYEMMNILNQLESFLDSTCKFIDLGSEAEKELTLAVKNWWEQGAQHVLKIVCEGKTIKMWQDILMCLSDI